MFLRSVTAFMFCSGDCWAFMPFSLRNMFYRVIFYCLGEDILCIESSKDYSFSLRENFFSTLLCYGSIANLGWF